MPGVLAVAAFFLAPYIVMPRSPSSGLFGLMLIPLAAAAAFDIRLALQRPEVDDRLLRRWSAAHLLLIFAFGAASFFEPSWNVGDVAFRGSERRWRSWVAR